MLKMNKGSPLIQFVWKIPSRGRWGKCMSENMFEKSKEKKNLRFENAAIGAALLSPPSMFFIHSKAEKKMFNSREGHGHLGMRNL